MEGLLSLAQARKADTSLTHIYIWGNHLGEPVCQVTLTAHITSAVSCLLIALPPQAFAELMSSGRLLPQQTDVSAYDVDGHVFLAEVSNSLRRHHHSSTSSDSII